MGQRLSNEYFQIMEIFADYFYKEKRVDNLFSYARKTK